MATGFFFTACQQAVFAAGFLLQGDGSDFKDLGKLLLGGFALAVAAAVGFTIVRLRLRDKKPPAAQFISINSSKSKKQ
jgi:hypothetical protein